MMQQLRRPFHPQFLFNLTRWCYKIRNAVWNSCRRRRTLNRRIWCHLSLFAEPRKSWKRSRRCCKSQLWFLKPAQRIRRSCTSLHYVWIIFKLIYVFAGVTTYIVRTSRATIFIECKDMWIDKFLLLKILTFQIQFHQSEKRISEMSWRHAGPSYQLVVPCFNLYTCICRTNPPQIGEY